MAAFRRKPETGVSDASLLEKLSDRCSKKGSHCDASRTADREQRRQWQSTRPSSSYVSVLLKATEAFERCIVPQDQVKEELGLLLQVKCPVNGVGDLYT
jgi:hypothetical protein